MKKIIIAIDGFSACGKSTMAKSLAREIGYIYIDSGAMYRAVALYCIRHQLFDAKGNIDTLKLEEKINSIKIGVKLDASTQLPVTYLNNENVEPDIRTMEVSEKVSMVSAISFVRRAMVALQQEMGKDKGIVMDGRDIGTVVFPDAELKIFVTAQPKIRAQRRLDELRTKGDTDTSFDNVFANLTKRDEMDQNREDSPLKQAEDALVLDNSYMTRDEQMQWLLVKYNSLIN